jgi:acetyltransferase-like isoleucine patch superfamily enzyme
MKYLSSFKFSYLVKMILSSISSMDRWLSDCRVKFRQVYLPFRYQIGSCGQNIAFGEGIIIEGVGSNIFIGSNVSIGDHVRIVCTDENSKIYIGDGSIIHFGSQIDTGPGGSIHIGQRNSVNPYCVIYGHGGLTTGMYVRIAAHTVIIPANHIYKDPNIIIAKQGLTKKGINIEDDVWIGTGSRILDGINIGHGTVVGAGAVVTKDVPPMAVVAGVPAKIIKMRSNQVELKCD